MNVEVPDRLTMARANGRCTGALVFAVFGGGWLMLALTYAHRLHWPAVLAVLALVLALVSVALLLKRRAGKDAETGYPEAEKKASDKRFYVINAYTYGAVFLLFLILPRLHLSNYVFPAFVFIVGLHFLPMPPIYRHRANTVTGVIMMMWAVACVVLFHHNGELEAAWVTCGAGILLWTAAAFALASATRLLQRSRTAGNSLYT